MSTIFLIIYIRTTSTISVSIRSRSVNYDLPTTGQNETEESDDYSARWSFSFPTHLKTNDNQCTAFSTEIRNCHRSSRPGIPPKCFPPFRIRGFFRGKRFAASLTFPRKLELPARETSGDFPQFQRNVSVFRRKSAQDMIEFLPCSRLRLRGDSGPHCGYDYGEERANVGYEMPNKRSFVFSS